MKKRIILYILIVDLILFGISSMLLENNKSYNSTEEVVAINELYNYKNIYYKDKDFNFVQNSNVKVINNKQDFLNLFYTMLNNGYDFYDFKCSNKYITCGRDIISTLNDTNTINVINNLVNAYNSTNGVFNVKYLSNGDIRLYANKKYSYDEINYLNIRVDYIISMIISNKMSDKEKIKQVHDYLTNNINYSYSYKADSAYSALVNNYAICGGYADAFSIFMDRLGIENYKVVSSNHVWNVVYIDNEWKHIDLTWDDPKNNYNINNTKYDYFLINTNKLRSNDLTEHNFNLNIYTELA